MGESMAQEVGLLRKLAEHLERRPPPLKRLTQALLRMQGLGHVHETAGGMTAIRMPGQYAFTELTNCLLDRLPAMERGAIYADVQTELFDFIESYVGREPSTIGNQEAEALVAHFANWFAGKSQSRRVFVPCIISRIPASRFEIGPVTFEFIDNIPNGDFYPHGGESPTWTWRAMDDLIHWMREGQADWLARVAVDGCERGRAEEIGELAVDLAIVSLQLSAPYHDTRTMARLDARRGTTKKRTLSEANGSYRGSWTIKEPGMVIGAGALTAILQERAPIFAAVGNVVRSFASGSFRLPGLERAWCDAAYWLHQALAESIDSIAIAKLETALEVLLRVESSKGSTKRMLEVLDAFFNLEPDDPVVKGSLLSAQQFARNVVRDRSRILHGTWSTLNARGIDRAGMEGFAITVIGEAALHIEEYAHSTGAADDINEFLGWVKQRKSSKV
ncbi:hypothetical protein C5688_12035 [Methylocystis sp. MitZ-2018]|nr:hypothetical protein C5688_12035 [Methylocystis sp. MitZ-2018]